MDRHYNNLHNFTGKLVFHVMVDDYVRGIASPVEALYLVEFFAPEQYIDVVFNTGLKIYGIDEIMEGAMLRMGMEAVCRPVDGEDAAEVGNRLMRVVGVDERFRPFVRDPQGPIGYIDRLEVEALDMKRLRPLVEMAVPRLAPMEHSRAA